MTMVIFLTGLSNQSRRIANLFDFYVFSTIWMIFGMWIINAPDRLLLLFSCLAPGLLLACSWPAPGLLLPRSWSCPPQFGCLYHHQHLTTFFDTARAAFYGSFFLYSSRVRVCTQKFMNKAAVPDGRVGV